jgi:pimeloyl-ACP methyl ester carboxylesterase
MNLLRHVVASAAFAAASVGSIDATAQPTDPVLAFDHLVPHVSTVPAVFGQPTQIFVRERVLKGLANRQGTAWNGKVVLMLHGGTYGAVPVYDFEFKDYSWMRYLAQQGFDVFAMDFNGYGGSGRPTMDDPCNTQASLQFLLIPGVIPAACAPSYPFQLNTAVSERDELNRVIDYIRELRGVDKVSVVGYSGGGFRGGTYTSLNEEKVDKLIILASSNYNRNASSNPPAAVPARGSPMTIQSRQILEEQRWFPNVQCEGQVEPGAADAAWAASIATDPVGATWGPGVMRAPNRTLWGWNAAAAANITVPTLVMAGQFDGLLASMNLLYADLGSSNKVLIEIACASHFYTWESQHTVVREASKHWLLHGSILGVRNGMLWADEAGKFHKAAE